MAQRYFLNERGIKTERMQGLPGQGHIEIANEVLPQHGVVPSNDQEIYGQMWELRYARIVEHDNNTIEVEHGRPLTTRQKRYLNSLHQQGRTITITEKT
jgi:hypothetical protein